MYKIVKSLSFYIAVTAIVILVALATPSITKEKEIKKIPSISVLNVVRHGDSTYSVILQERSYDVLDESQVDSILLMLTN